MKQIESICIVGGGPSGVAVAKHLLGEKHFSRIDIFEQRANVGGVWDYYPANDDDFELRIVPSTNPDVPMDSPIWRRSHDRLTNDKIATFQSPLYERLEANLPKMLMQHSDTPFDEQSQLFPTHDDIQAYLERYAVDVRHLITLETQVSEIRRNFTEVDSPSWSVDSTNLRTSKTTTQTYDAVVIASGHYTVPFIPPIPGVEAWHAAYSSTISHSRYYRAPEAYAGKKVVLIGSGPSAVDIASQIAAYCAKPLIVSRRSEPKLGALPSTSRSVPEIAEFLPPYSKDRQRAVRFADGSIEKDIDAVLFCTGYLYSYPFLPNAPVAGVPLIVDGQQVNHVYEHIFYMPDPSLAFMALPWNIVPFPVAEAQGATVARVWSGRIELPSMLGMLEWATQTAKENGSGKAFHRLAVPKDVEYINRLYRWCCQAEAEQGKGLVFWDERMRWLRESVKEVKRAFADRGEKRRGVKTLEDLGFWYSNGA